MSASKRVMIVSSLNDAVQTLVKSLEKSGYRVLCAANTQEARQMITDEGVPHLIVVEGDVMDMDGLEFCQEKFDSHGLPIMVLGGESVPSEWAIDCLAYADDYVRRPFDPNVVAMRVRRILSRVPNFRYSTGKLIRAYDWLTIDHENRQLRVRGVPMRLTPTENMLLQTLLSQRGATVSAATLIETTWPQGDVGDANALRVHIHRLRNKIEQDASDPKVIQTVRGIGYMFAEA